MKTSGINPIPKALEPLISRIDRALNGAKIYGAAIGLSQNTEARIAADKHALTGAADNGPQRGIQGQLSAAILASAAARKALKAALADGRKFCSTCVDLLKARYGRQWGPLWAEVGFAWGSLSAPRDPLPMILDLREYFLAHPAHESADLNVSAVRCNAVADAIGAAHAALDGAKAATHAVRGERREAQQQLKKRLTGLRNELAQLLSPEDSRWYQFGFNRPADGRMPAEVEGLTLEPGTPGEVHVRWEAASLAQNYRVTRQVAGVDAEPVEAGLFADLATMVRGLPSGKPVTVRVSARNETGESAPAEASIVVP